HLRVPAGEPGLALSPDLVRAVVHHPAERVERVDRAPFLRGEQEEGIEEVRAARPGEARGDAHAAHRHARHASDSLATGPWRGRRRKPSYPTPSMRSRIEAPPSQVRRISKRRSRFTRSQRGRPRSKRARVRSTSSAMSDRKPSVTFPAFRSHSPTP